MFSTTFSLFSERETEEEEFEVRELEEENEVRETEEEEFEVRELEEETEVRETEEEEFEVREDMLSEVSASCKDMFKKQLKLKCI